MAVMWGTRAGPDTFRVYRAYAEKVDEFHPADRLRITVDLDRNGKFNSLFHVMLDKLAKAINRGPATTTPDALKKWVKIKKEWYDLVEVTTPRGQTVAIDYHSTSFAAMGEDEFKRFALDACELIRAELAPWVSASPEWEDVRAIIASISGEQV